MRNGMAENTVSSPMQTSGGCTIKRRKKNTWNKDMKKNWSMYLLFIPCLFSVFSATSR